MPLSDVSVRRERYHLPALKKNQRILSHGNISAPFRIGQLFILIGIPQAVVATFIQILVLFNTAVIV